MRKFKKLFAVIFAVWAVMLMSVAVFAQSHRFTIQPTDKSYYTGAAVSFTLNFTPVGNTELWAVGDTDYINNYGDGSGCPVDNERAIGKTCYIKAYYGTGANDYVTSQTFKVKANYAFTKQPKDVTYDNSSTSADFELNFKPIDPPEVWALGKTTYINKRGGYAGCPIDTEDAKGKICYIKAYYGSGENEYVTSNFFNVNSSAITKKFTQQPQDITYGETLSVEYKLNFAPVGTTELWAVGETGCIHKRGFSTGCSVDEIKAAGKTCYIKAYYGTGEDDYITSRPFKVTNNYCFTEQPKDITYGKDKLVNYELNFNPLNAPELWALGGTSFIHKRGGTSGCLVDTEDARNKMCFIKAYYGEGEDDYIISDIFNVCDDYTLSFDANGGSGTMGGITLRDGSEISLPACSYTAPTGKTFDYWKIGISQYKVGESYTVRENVTAYAVWKNKNCIVTFDVGDYPTTPSRQFVIAFNTAAEPELPDDFNGKYVSGWYTDSNFANAFSFDTAITDDITLYAKWENIDTVDYRFALSQTEYTAMYGDTIKLNSYADYGGKFGWKVTSGAVSGTPSITTSVPYYNLDTKLLDPSKQATIRLVIKNENGDTRGTAYMKLNLIYKQGDIDGNGNIDNTDAALYLKHLSGNTAYQFTAEQFKRADVNYDGKYDMLDVIVILGKAS